MPSKEELPLTGYMGAICFLMILLFPPLKPLTRYRTTLIILTVASLLLTWSQMILFLQKSHADSAVRAGVPLSQWTPQRWLGSTQLFHEAWWYVCATTERWWWSSQICTGAVGVWTPFLWSEGRRHKIKYLAAYMLLGQIVAISFASGLFLLALPVVAAATTSPSSANPTAPLSLLFAVLIGQASTFAIPYVLETPYFLPVLLIMHLFLFAPLLPSSFSPIPTASLPRIQLSTIYYFSALFSSIHYLLITLQLPPPPEDTSLPRHLFDVLAHHPAQASVSLDVLSFVALTFLHIASDWRSQVSARARTRRRGQAKGTSPEFAIVALAVWTLTPIVGPAATFAGYFAWRERAAAETERLKKQAASSQ